MSTIVEKLNKIRSYVHYYDFYFDYENLNDNLINKTYDLFINHEIDLSLNDNDVYMDMLGLYYGVFQSKYKKGKKQYFDAIKNGNTNAMNNFGKFWDLYLENENEGLKYYIMSANKGSKTGMLNAGLYFYNQIDNFEDPEQIKKNRKLIKYFKMAIDKDCTQSMIRLGIYYYKIKDNNNALKYLKMASENNINSNFYLGMYYEKNNNYEGALKHYSMKPNDEDCKIRFQNIIKKIPSEQMIELSKKYNIKLPEDFQSRIQFIINKKKFAKDEECVICMDEKKVIPYDCFGHYFCESCYHKLDKCPVCRFDKHPIMNNNIDEDNDYDNDELTYIGDDDEEEERGRINI